MKDFVKTSFTALSQKPKCIVVAKKCLVAALEI